MSDPLVPLAVETRALDKSYGDVEALRGLDLRVESGSFFGLLGPNGAGKTTVVSILCTMLRASGGEASVFGCDVATERAAVRSFLGIVFQDPTLDTALTAQENLEIHGRLYRVPDRAGRIVEVLDLMGMREYADRVCRTLSGGMRRRLEIARALMHRPRILFLDEPTVGLDVPSRRTLWEQLEQLRSSGLTLVLTTHAMDEAERLCDRVAVLDEGLVAASGSPRELCDAVGGDRIEVELDATDGALARVLELEGIEAGELRGDTAVLTVSNAPGRIVAVIEALKPLGVRAVRMREANLEDAFLHFTGHRMDSTGNLE